MNKVALLADLKIDREPQGDASRFQSFALLMLVIAGLVLLGGLVWYFTSVVPPPVVEVATVRPVANDMAGGVLLEASGYVVARREATVSAKVTGRVTELLIEEGQQVVAGQVLAKLDASNVSAAMDEARAQIGVAQANADLARVTELSAREKLARTEKLDRSGWVSKQSLEDARSAYATARSSGELARRQIAAARASMEVTGRGLDDTIVRAPFSGVVTVKAAQVGEIVSPISAGGGFTRTGIGTIVDMHSLEVEVDVAEGYINRVKAGMPVTVGLSAYPDWAIPAEVAAIIPTGDRSKATVKVRIRFHGEDPRILPEMGAKVSFLTSPQTPLPGASGSTEVPARAIVASSGDRSSVFIVGDGLKLARRRVRLGPRSDDRQVILAGLRAGERVVTSGQAALQDGMVVRTNAN